MAAAAFPRVCALTPHTFHQRQAGDTCNLSFPGQALERVQ